MAQNNSEIRYLNPPTVEVKRKKYCRFKKAGIKYVDYKDAEFLKKFLNEQGKDSASPSDRNFPQIPEEGCPGSEESKASCTSPIRYGSFEITGGKTWKSY